MMKSLTALLVLSIISVAYSYEYTATVVLGDYSFNDVEGSVKLKIHGPYSTDTFRLIQTYVFLFIDWIPEWCIISNIDSV